MTRFVENHISPEMVALWLLELVLSFSLAYVLLSTGPLAAGVQPVVVNHSLVLALTSGFTAFAIGLYRPEGFRRMRGLLLNTALGGVLAFPAVWLVSKALGIGAQWTGPDALWALKVGAAWIAALFATRLLFLAAVRSNLLVRPIALLGPPSAMATTVAAIRGGHEGFFEVVVGPAANTGPARLRAAGIRDAVLPRSALLAMPPREQAGYAAQGVTLATEAQFWERCLKRVDVSGIDAAWVAGLDAPHRVADLLSRAGDVAISLAFLAATLPLMLLVALAVRLSGPGPVLYRQERVGLGGHPFTLLKFRSMRADAEARGPAWATQRDPRVTSVGAFLRRTRIDELPQLLNVLQGTMSFIGPRPERPHFVDQLEGAIPHYRERARVKPGLTGWAQVNFPYGASVEDARVKLSYDLYYVKHRGVLLDLAILVSTVRVILFQEGSR